MTTSHPTPAPALRGARWLLALVLVLLAALSACSPRGADPTPPPPDIPGSAVEPTPTTAPVQGPALPSTPPGQAEPTAPASAARQGLDLTILHTNDVRGEIEPCG